MDKIAKALLKLSAKERQKIKTILLRLLADETKGLNIKRLKDSHDIFRVRFGNIRIIYRTDRYQIIVVLKIARRNERTYKSLI